MEAVSPASSESPGGRIIGALLTIREGAGPAGPLPGTSSTSFTVGRPGSALCAPGGSSHAGPWSHGLMATTPHGEGFSGQFRGL